MDSGTIIFLNGTSSAGKSSIACALQELMPVPYLHTGIDHFLLRMPAKLHADGDDIMPCVADGFLWVRSPDKRLRELRIGPKGYQLIEGMYRAIAALATSGLDIVVDDVVFDRRALAAAVLALVDLHVLFVGVRCPIEVAVQREQARGDRMLGLVQAHYYTIHTHGVYDLEVDTSLLRPEECAYIIQQRLEHGPSPTALQTLQAKLARE